MGWKCEVSETIGKKGIIALAPHTSNFDFILGILYSRAEGIKSNFLMKRMVLLAFRLHYAQIGWNTGLQKQKDESYRSVGKSSQ